MDRNKDPGLPSFWEHRGRWTFGAQLGLALENDIPRNISHVTMLIAQPHVGLTVHEFRRSPVARFSIVSEGILGNAVHPGGRLLGTSLFFRFDGRPHGRVAPYLNLGSGVLHTTLNTRTPELSGRVQFFSQAGIGLQYFFNPQRAFVLEYRYAHMSNAGLEPPNDGFNASMLTLGFRWLLRPHPPGWQASKTRRGLFHFLFGAD